MPNTLVDHVGDRFGRLTVIGRGENPYANGSAFWLCRCDCGRQTTQPGYALRKGNLLSCGCHKREQRRRLNLEDNPFLHLPAEQRLALSQAANYRSAKVRLGKRIERTRAQIAALEAMT